MAIDVTAWAVVAMVLVGVFGWLLMSISAPRDPELPDWIKRSKGEEDDNA